MKIKSPLNRRIFFAVLALALMAGPGLVLTSVAGAAEPNLVAHWTFDDDVKDSSGNGYDGTIVGAMNYVDGRISKALDFDGLNDHVEVAGLTNPVKMTYALWVKADGYSGSYNTLLEFGNDDPWFGITWWEGKVEFYGYLTSSRSITIGRWYHIAVTSDGSQSIIYIDGVACGTGPANIQTGTGLGIGYHDGDAHFDGLIDDVRIYNKAISAEEIMQLCQEGWGGRAFNPNPEDGATSIDLDTVLSWSPGKDAAYHDVYFGTDWDDVNDADTSTTGIYRLTLSLTTTTYDPPEELLHHETYYWRIDEVNGPNTWKGDVWSFRTWALVSWWKFDEGQGITAYDSAGDNHGTLINNPTWTTGQIGGALSFDGLDDYIDVAHNQDFDIETGFTVVLWFKAKPTQLSPDGLFAVIDKSHRSTESPPYWSGWVMQGDPLPSGRLWFGIGNGADFPGVSTNKNILDDVWHHIAGIFNGTKVKLYLDAVLQGSTVFSGTPVNNTDPLNIGRWAIGATRNFNGLIDEVHIYKQALSGAKIQQLYQERLRSKAFGPNPADGATSVRPDAVLSWMPGKGAPSHDVYFGTNYSDVKIATTATPLDVYKGRQSSTSYIPTLTGGTTYYWRIDEVEGSNTWEGDVWSFTTAPFTARNPSPADGTINVNVGVVLSWDAGFDVPWHDVYLGTDFNDVNDATISVPLGVYEGRQSSTSYTPTLAGGTTHYWRIDEVYTVSKIYKGQVWRFTTIPSTARNPSPADGAVDVVIDEVLSWDAGFDAVSHNVYFGTSIPPPFKANQIETIYDPCIMTSNTTYYWRIDEVGPGGTFTGDLWSFTTSFYATIPDTLDLQYRARLGINALTRCTNSSEGYRVYWLGELNRKPPILTQPYSSSLSNLYGKFTQSLALCRMATQSTFNTACDIVWKNTITNLFDPGPGPSVTPGVDGGRMLATLSHYYLDDNNSTWLTYAQSMVNQSVNEFHDKGDWGYFGGSMPQGWEATFHSWILQGLAHYYRVSGDSTTYTMGNKVANFLKSHAQVFDSNGRFLAKHSSGQGPAFHFHHNGNSMEALTEWVLASGDAALASFVNDSYQYAKSVSWPVIGFFPEYINGEYPDWWRRGRFEDCEACSVYDMMLTALNLTRSGGYDYWDDVDMYTRNMNANMQMTNGDWIYDMIAGYPEQGVPGDATDVNVPERVVGDVAGWCFVNDFIAWLTPSIQHCCLGNAGRAWYHVWANILSYDSAANTLAVNLLLKRFSEYADVASFLPYEGRVEIDVKRTFTDMSVRMPGHVDLATVQCTVNGQTRSVSWNGRYLQTGFVKAGDAIAITFTLSEREEQITIARTTYNLIIRGHTCVSIDPPGTYYPYFEGEHYRTGPVQYKYVQKLVGKDIINMEYECNCVEATMQFTPQTLNCNSKGNWVKAHFTLPEGFLPEDVDIDTPAIAEPMSANSEYINVFGDKDGPVRLEICFDREDFCDLLTDDNSLEITVIGSLTTSQYFYGTDTIKIKPQRQ